MFQPQPNCPCQECCGECFWPHHGKKPEDRELLLCQETGQLAFIGSRYVFSRWGPGRNVSRSGSDRRATQAMLLLRSGHPRDRSGPVPHNCQMGPKSRSRKPGQRPVNRIAPGVFTGMWLGDADLFHRYLVGLLSFGEDWVLDGSSDPKVKRQPAILQRSSG